MNIHEIKGKSAGAFDGLVAKGKFDLSPQHCSADPSVGIRIDDKAEVFCTMYSIGSATINLEALISEEELGKIGRGEMDWQDVDYSCQTTHCKNWQIHRGSRS